MCTERNMMDETHIPVVCFDQANVDITNYFHVESKIALDAKVRES